LTYSSALSRSANSVGANWIGQQRIVVVGEVLAACFAGFLLLLVFLVLLEIIFDLLSKTFELHEECTVLMLIEFCEYNFRFL